MNEALPTKTYRRRNILAGGLFLLMGFTLCIYAALKLDSKPDPESEMKIRREVSRIILNETGLTKSPENLTDEDFTEITRLTLGRPYVLRSHTTFTQELVDIKFLKKFTNLEYLCIGSVQYPSNKIPRWISLLEKIGISKFKGRLALDLKPLKDLNNLENLTIHNMQVRNFKTIENLTNLRELHLANTMVPDLKPLKKLKKLKTLYISNCTDISEKQLDELLKAMPNLEIYR